MTLGSLGKALSPEMDAVVENRKVWVKQITSLTPGNYQGVLALAEELASVREGSLKFLEWVEGWYRDILIYFATGSCQGISNLDMAKYIEQQAALYSLERILFLLSQAVEATARIQRNFNRRMTLENFFAHVASPDYSRPRGPSGRALQAEGNGPLP